jgi:excinuclease ABC subunit C
MFKDRGGRILYVGKAKDLRKRVLSYLKPKEELPQKTRLMMERAEDLETILTATENEAFILEDTLVKRHQPRYNVVLRDDKRYPWVRLDPKEDYPGLRVVRRIKKDGALYFGPFSSAGAVRSTLKLIETVFPLRKCKGGRPPKRSRPCLNYQVGRCLAPCTREVPQEVYRGYVEEVRLFLEGRNRELVVRLKQGMKAASEAMEFEKAARIRDRLQAVERTIERQHVVSRSMEDWDAAAVEGGEGLFKVVVLHVRKGALAGSRDYSFRNPVASPAEIMEAFVKQYYAGGAFIPKRVLVNEEPGDMDSIRGWLSDLAGRRVALYRPLRGEKLELVKMAEANARNLARAAEGVEGAGLMEQVKEALHLEEVPERIEGLDISNVQGRSAVGAVVSFREGKPDKAGYRSYRIKAVEGIDDYGMMAEMVARRLNQGEAPDLFLVDGGRGHLAAVARVVEDAAGPDGPAVAAIAKRDEKSGEKADKIFIRGRKNPLPLGPDHPVLHLLMRVRDEAHRRAVGYHRKLRGKDIRSSMLDSVPGIGPKKKSLLLSRFGDVETLLSSKPEEIAATPGVSLRMARDILRIPVDDHSG